MPLYPYSVDPSMPLTTLSIPAIVHPHTSELNPFMYIRTIGLNERFSPLISTITSIARPPSAPGQNNVQCRACVHGTHTPS